MWQNINKKGRKWLKILSFCLVGATLTASIATLATVVPLSTSWTSNNSSKTDNINSNTSMKLEQMSSVIKDFTKSANINTNSRAFRITFAKEIEKMSSSKEYITSLVNQNISDSQYSQLCTLLNNLKGEYGKGVYSTANDANARKITNIKQVSINLFNLNNQLNLFSYKNEVVPIIQNAINDLQNLSSNLGTQTAALEGTGATISSFLGILSFFDLGTTAALAIAIGCVFGFVCTGIGGIIKTINESIAKLKNSISQNQSTLDASSTLQQTESAINSCISSLQNAYSKLKNDDWIVGMNSALSELTSAINELQSINRNIQNAINQLN